MLSPDRRGRRRQHGLSLIEMMIAMSAGLVVVGAGLSFLVSASSAAGANLLRVRLHQDLHAAIDAIGRDLTRAGEWALADEVAFAAATADLELTGTHGSVAANVRSRGGAMPRDAFGFPNAPPALTGATLALLEPDGGGGVRRHDAVITGVPAPDRLSLWIPEGAALADPRVPAGRWSVLNPFAGVRVDASGHCVLVRYDLDADGVLDDEEHFGFRLNAARTAIQASTTARDCTSGNWDAFTDPAFMRVEALDVRRLRAPATGTAPLRTVVDAYLVGLDARLARDRLARRSVRHLVHVRNAAVE